MRLLHLPQTRTAEAVADAMIAAIKELSATLTAGAERVIWCSSSFGSAPASEAG